jgi:hypothetical protein
MTICARVQHAASALNRLTLLGHKFTLSEYDINSTRFIALEARAMSYTWNSLLARGLPSLILHKLESVSEEVY